MKIIANMGVISLAPENTFSGCYALKSINKNWMERDVMFVSAQEGSTYSNKNTSYDSKNNMCLVAPL